jgi:telomere length regulation protein
MLPKESCAVSITILFGDPSFKSRHCSSLIEEFTKNQYSTNQRYVILNALALGARELASLPLPASALPPISSARIAFPSKTLPAEQHRKYVAAGNQADVVQQMLESISLSAIKNGKDDSIDKAPELVRERRLRIQKPAKVVELTRPATSTTVTKPRLPTETTFTEVAAEFFIVPLINRFWLFLRDEQTREERTVHHETLHQYRGAGTGLILNPMVLAHFLATLAVLVHAARNAPEWLAVVAPDALELAVTLGTRPLSRHDNDEDDGPAGGPGGEAKSKEASVLTAALELALIVLDGCLELDGGRSVGLDHTALLLGTGEWAGGVFSLLEKGARVPGGGGALEARLRGAAAGVLIKVDSLTSTWRRSMVNITW